MRRKVVHGEMHVNRKRNELLFRADFHEISGSGGPPTQGVALCGAVTAACNRRRQVR